MKVVVQSYIRYSSHFIAEEQKEGSRQHGVSTTSVFYVYDACAPNSYAYAYDGNGM
jgi:hypothetical protein